MPAITDKADMYRRLARGEFGNTVPMWADAVDWYRDPARDPYRLWGVRTLTPGGPCAFYVPSDAVPDTVRGFRPHRVNISPMVDAVTTVRAWLEVWESPTGRVVEGVPYPDTPRETWRNTMPDPARRRAWFGVAARLVLGWALNENSRADLDALLEARPGHVVELSALDRCIGTVPHRNAIVWEVRMY